MAPRLVPMAHPPPEEEIILFSPPGLADDSGDKVVVVGSGNLDRSQASDREPVSGPRDDSES
jgi:hypothetical protein